MMVKLALVPDPNQCGNETRQLLASFHALRHSPVSVLLAFGENGGEGGGGGLVDFVSYNDLAPPHLST